MVQIIPAVLSTSEKDFERDIKRLNKIQSFKDGWVHIDFADNIFVQNKTISPSVVSKYPIEMHKEAHLMVVHPFEWVNDLYKANFERIIFHIEIMDDIQKCIKFIKGKGLEAGLAINHDTPIGKLEPFVNDLDIVLIMGIIPGFQGQKFIPDTLEKIRDLKSKNWDIQIGVDGSVKNDNIKDIVESGADFVTVGSYLLKGNMDENMENLWEAINLPAAS